MCINEWFHAMNRCSEGKLTINNIQCDLNGERLPDSVVQRFFLDISLRWEEARHNGFLIEKTEEELAKIATQIFNDVIELHDFEDDCFYCQGVYQPQNVERIKFSRVMSWKEFIKYHIKDNLMIKGEDQSPSSEQIYNIVQYWQDSFNPESRMRTRRPFAWITKSEILEEIQVNIQGETKGSILRDRLGLVHYKAGDGLVEVKYPQEELKNVSIKAPTFLDSKCSHDSAFCSTTEQDGYGRTINLGTYTADLPEVVHSETRFSEDYQIEDLGKVRHKHEFQQHKVMETVFPNQGNINLETLIQEVITNYSRG